MNNGLEASIPQKDPEVLKFQRALENQALAHIIETRAAGKEFFDHYDTERGLSEAGTLFTKEGKETDKQPSHLILDLGIYKELERKTKEALAHTA